MAVSELRLKGCQELPEDSWIPRGQARQQRVERPEPRSQTDLASDPDQGTFQLSDFGCMTQHLSLFPHKYK